MPISYSRYRNFSVPMRRRYRSRYGSDHIRKLRSEHIQQRKSAQPKPPAAPEGEPAAPSQPDFSPTFNARYETTIGGINRNLGSTEADLNYNEQRVRQQFGFDDPSNPFAVARMLKRQYDQRREGTTNSYAAQGQLYAGSLQNAQDENRFGYERETDEARRQYDDLINDIIRRRTQARQEAEEARAMAEADRLEAQIANRPEDPGPPEPEAPQSRGYLPPGYSGWDLAKKRRYWSRRRKARGY